MSLLLKRQFYLRQELAERKYKATADRNIITITTIIIIIIIIIIIPSTCACGENFTVDHAMICKRGGFVIQRHNELRDLEADLLSMVCSDVEVEPVLQDITEEQLSRRSNRAQDARLDIRARGFWDPQNSAFFDVRVCHPNAESYKD